jgi:hypothetical protein
MLHASRHRARGIDVAEGCTALRAVYVPGGGVRALHAVFRLAHSKIEQQ